MTTRGGEEPAAKGRQFDDSVLSLLDTLHYKVIFRHKHGFDLVADPPLSSGEMIRPLLGPEGRTAFEFKAGKTTPVETVAKQLRKKLQRAKKTDSPVVRKIVSGVVVVEGYVADSLKQKVAKSYMIQLWDFRTVLFLLAKVVFHLRLSSLRSFREIMLDSSTTLVYENKTSSIDNREVMRFLCNIFYCNPSENLTIDRARAIVSIMTKKLNAIARGITIPTYASIGLFSLSGLSDDLTDKSLKKLLESSSAGKIIYDVNARIYGFDTAPWAFLL
jgi:hypothetical protein